MCSKIVSFLSTPNGFDTKVRLGGLMDNVKDALENDIFESVCPVVRCFQAHRHHCVTLLNNAYKISELLHCVPLSVGVSFNLSVSASFYLCLHVSFRLCACVLLSV